MDLDHYCSLSPFISIRYYGDILRGLFPLFGESEQDDAVRDNAAGAVARMIMVHPQSIPLNQVKLLVLIISIFFGYFNTAFLCSGYQLTN